MASGFSVNGVCYASAQEAVGAYYSKIPPAFQQTATTSYKLQYLFSGGSWFLQRQTISSTGVLTTNYTIAAPSNVYGSCTVPNDPYTNFKDGMTLGWAVAAAMVIVYVIRRPHR